MIEQLQKFTDEIEKTEPPGLTVERVQEIQRKPENEWTDEERAYMEAGAKWAAEAMTAIVQLISPVMERVIVAMSDLGERIRSEWLSADSAPSDEYRYTEGLPGISGRCWADVWIDDDAEYVVCNQAAVNELGTCAEHQLGGSTPAPLA